ncbi:MAG: hypothetical protein Q9217_004409 [Psora testacea]
MHASKVPLGELKMSSPSVPITPSGPKFYAIIEASEYLLPLLYSALSKSFAPHTYGLISDISQLPTPTTPLLQLRPYESLEFTHLLSHPSTSLANAYIIRKAVIRKHYLWQSISSWWVKHPNDTALKGHVPVTVSFELDYAEFLDEALIECWELKENFEREEEGKEWWVLKPAMSDQGHGVRLFRSEQELRAIFEEWEAEGSSGGEDEDEAVETPLSINGVDRIGAGTMTSQLRHFVAQRYIERPLLFEDHRMRKFHIRSYVLAVGALKVYVYRDMLALFAPLPYIAPSNGSEPTIDPLVHLTNTCLQSGTPLAGSVHRFWDLPSSNAHNTTSQKTNLAATWKCDAFTQIANATSTLFEAAAREQMIHLQALPNAFEVFGLDWMVDETGNVWLLEANAFPDFRQSGDALKGLVGSLWEAVVKIAVVDFFRPDERSDINHVAHDMAKVLDIDLGRG